MPYFVYKAKDKQGKLITGTLEAESRASVVSRLQAMAYFPLQIQGEEQAEEKGLSGAIGQVRRMGARVKGRDLTMFYRQMSDLVGAGVPLVKALAIIKNQCPTPALKTILSQIDQDVQGGDTFAKALGHHPKTFNPLSTAMIQAGETGGLLDETLYRLADFAEMEEEVRARIKSALAYPVIMIIAGGLAVAVLMTFVIPRIVGIFDELNQTLPVLTQILITVSAFLSGYWYIIAGALALAFLLLKKYVATETGGLQYDGLLLRIPILGEVILKREVARFTRTLGSLLRNGVPILTSLEVSMKVLTNAVIRKEVAKVPDGIAQGGGMANTLRDSVFFPPVVITMISVGEETGNLAGILLKVASTYETQVDRSVKTLTSIIEPLIILFMGLLVGFIVIAMLLPIFELDPTAG